MSNQNIEDVNFEAEWHNFKHFIKDRSFIKNSDHILIIAPEKPHDIYMIDEKIIDVFVSMDLVKKVEGWNIGLYRINKLTLKLLL